MPAEFPTVTPVEVDDDDLQAQLAAAEAARNADDDALRGTVATEETLVEVRDAIGAASTAIVTAIQVAAATETSAVDAVLTELEDKLEPADIASLATAANQSSEITALGNLITELAQKLEPGDLSALATAAHQATIEGKLDSLITELGQKLEAADVAALATAANQVTQNGKLDSLLTELAQKLEPADLSALSTAAKQDAAKAVFDTMSSTLSNIAGYVDGLEAAEASNLAKLEAIRLLLASTLLVGSALAMGDSGRKTSTSVGTAVALPTVAAKFVRVTALLTNTQQVATGGAAVLATAGSTTGDQLLAGDSTTYVVTNLNQIFLDVRVSGEGVAYTYWT